MPNPTLSIVTVVKDDLLGLVKTQSSLEQQICQDFEWVIVDGSSNSTEIATAIQDFPAQCTYIWLEPKGIYPAMNAGLRQASGEYVWFVNAGDEAAEASTVEGLLGVLRDRQPNWLVGQVEFAYPGNSARTPPLFNYQAEKKRLFARGRFPPHQGTIAQRHLLERLHGFNEGLQIAADYEMVLRLSLISDPIVLPQTLARFGIGGVSSRRWRLSLREFHSARHEVFDIHGIQRVLEAVDNFKVFSSMFIARLIRRV